MGVPHSWMVYFMENPVSIDDDWGYPHFRKPPYLPIMRQDACKLVTARPGCPTIFFGPHPWRLAPGSRLMVRKMDEPWEKKRFRKGTTGCHHPGFLLGSGMLIFPWSMVEVMETDPTWVPLDSPPTASLDEPRRSIPRPAWMFSKAPKNGQIQH